MTTAAPRRRPPLRSFALPAVVPVFVALPGRARLRVEGLRRRPDVAARLTAQLTGQSSIHRVGASAVTGNVLILFDATALDLRRLVAVVAQAAAPGPMPSEAVRPGADRWHTLTADAVVSEVETSIATGLDTTEAAARLARFGENRLPEPRPKSALEIITGHVVSVPVLVLGVAAALSLVSGALIDAGVILAVVTVNAAIGYVTERRVERILMSLQSATVPHALVRREGADVRIAAATLVVGDVLILRAGHDITADARVIDAEGLATDESSLTGESLPAAKRPDLVCDHAAGLADRANMVFAGTVVAEGAALAVVTATGRDTEIGRVRALVGETATPTTPLERQLDRLGRRLVGVSLAFCGGALALGLLRGFPFTEMIRSVISLAVAAVPEGLPAVATTTLALGVRRMSAQRTLVRRLAAAESLGATTVICADKTGTVTENRMTVYGWHLSGSEYRSPAAVYDARLARALAIGTLCNEAELANGGAEIRGSSTEGALLRAARDAGFDYEPLRRRFPLLGVRPRRDGENWMATLHHDGDRRLIAVKGAPEEVLARATRWVDTSGAQPLTADAQRAIRAANASFAARGMRVLGLAYRELPGDTEPVYDELVWLGLVALSDPVRSGVREAIAACRTAGIRTILITGDQAQTAAAIAHDLGIAHNGQVRVAEAGQLAGLDRSALATLAREVDVFARVTPAHKYEIVRALQAAGEVVAMTGDGINDAAALRAAAIGVAMGERGTDVARDVADVVLLDDDFGSIVGAIAQGRTIRDNIARALQFLLATNFSEILVTLGALAIGGARPLSATQFLWINLLSDVFPALALAVEPGAPDVMKRPPRDPAQPLLGRADLAGLGAEAAVLTATTLAAHRLALAGSGDAARAATVAFSALTTSQILHALNCRAGSGVSGVTRNPMLGAVVGGTVALQALATQVPLLRRILGVTPLAGGDWVLIGGAAVASLGLIRLGRGVTPAIAPAIRVRT
ncbi:MAG: ATPase [Candidatus Rokuibacteriota bacterium]|nr:MAG: ATPase [Candidatus Rokubacteria bacterium]